MKNRFKKYIVAIAMTISLTIISPVRLRAEEIFKDLSEMKNVESTFIDGKFSHVMPTWYSESGQRAIDLTNGFSALYIYKVTSMEGTEKARKILKHYLASHPEMNLMMRNKQADSEYLIYKQFGPSGENEKFLVWNSDSPTVCEIVVVEWNKDFKGKNSKN